MQKDERLPPVRLLYADELGQLKVVQTADGAQLGTAAVAASWGEPDKQHTIDCIALGSAGGVEDTATAVLAVARRSGAIELLSPLTGALLGAIPPAAPAAGGSSKQQEEAVRVRGLHLIWGASDAENGIGSSSSSLPAVLSVTQGGTARVHTAAAAGEQAQEGGSGAPAAWEQQRSWQVPPQVCCTAYDPASGRLAVGCEGAELRLFDAATGELVFTFKGGKPNKVGLVDKPWNTAIAFLPPTSTSSGSGSGEAAGGGGEAAGAAGTRLLVGTGYHKVRLYDSAAGKRPQMELSWGEGRVTALAVEPDGQRCWVGNGQGQLEVLDLDSRRFSGAIKGLAGSARALAVHPGGEVLACVCLDRYLRLHSCATRQLLAKVYCKTLPTGVAFCPTDASMLSPSEQPPAGEEERRRRKKDKKRERRRSQAAADEAEDGSGDDYMAAVAAEGSDDERLSDSEEEAEEQQERRRHKRSKPRREGGGRRKQRQQ